MTQRRAVRVVGTGLALGALPVAVLDAFPALHSRSPVAAVVATGIPYLPLPVLGACWAFGAASPTRRGRALWAAAGAGLAVASLCRWGRVAPGPGPEPTREDLRIVSANVLFGRADVHALAALAQEADVVAVQENDARFVEAFDALVAHDFPYRVGDSRDDGQGSMTWSRTPLTTAGRGRTAFTSIVVRTVVRGTTWTLANVHLVPPQHGSRWWARDARCLESLLVPRLGEHLVVVGDFNAIEEHLTVRRLKAAGFRSAMAGWSQALGDRWQPSWPTDRRRMPAVARIDHALHSPSVTAWRPRYVSVPGSDHRALVGVFRAS